jgi:hypothetical protein
MGAAQQNLPAAAGLCGRRQSRAFLLRQKSTGEEVVVMMTPIKSSGVTAATVVSRIPAYVATSGKISTPGKKPRSVLLNNYYIN